MSIKLEAFLARIYVDDKVRERFLADPYGEASKAGLTEKEIAGMVLIDRAGLELTVNSLKRKRQQRKNYH